VPGRARRSPASEHVIDVHGQAVGLPADDHLDTVPAAMTPNAQRP
jgi:hypothetical protein